MIPFASDIEADNYSNYPFSYLVRLKDGYTFGLTKFPGYRADDPLFA